MRNRAFARFLTVWAGQLVSGLGTGMTGFALGIHVFRETGSAAGFALVILCLFMPAILLRPVGGVLADRLDRRLLIILGDAGSAAAVVALLIILRGGVLPVGLVYLATALNSACGALQNPAYKASLTDLVPEESWGKAGGLVQLAASVQHLVSPLAAGLILGSFGLQAVLLIDAGTFLFAVIAALTLPGLRPCGDSPRTGFTADIAEGYRFLARERNTRSLVLLLAAVTFFVGQLQTLFTPMMLALTDATRLGLVQSISASGMLLSSLLIGLVGLPGGPAAATLAGLALAGLSMSLMGATVSLPLISGGFFLFFFCLPFVNTGAEVQIRRKVPGEIQGRVWGLVGFVTQAGYIMAYLSSGLLADTLFSPLLMPGGALAASLGRFIGTGPGRGIGLMLILSGLGLTLSAGTAALLRKAPHTQALQGAYRK